MSSSRRPSCIAAGRGRDRDEVRRGVARALCASRLFLRRPPSSRGGARPGRGRTVNGRAARLWGRGLLGVCLLLVTACCRRPFDFGPHPQDDPEAVLAAAEGLLARPATLEGEAKLRFRLPQGRFGADHLVVVAPPDRLRLDTLGFFGSPLAVLLVRDGELLLWDIDGGRAYRGPATRQTLSEILPLALAPAEVVDLLLGRPARPPGARPRLFLDQAARAYRVELRSEGRVQRRWFDPESGALLRVVEEVEGEVRWTATFEAYRHVGGEGSGELPYLVTIAHGESSLRFRWRSLKVGGPIDPGVFEVALPPGVPTVPIGGTLRWLPAEAEP